jgi:RNA polymerase-interacting CarD/CdnL/TRCF family regulator
MVTFSVMQFDSHGGGRINDIIQPSSRIDGFLYASPLLGWHFCFIRWKVEALMNLHEGDTVMHWTYGIGQVRQIEERTLFDHNVQYYKIQLSEMIIWVPADNNIESRLRAPTPKASFKRLFDILAGPGNPLPEDRYQRKNHLLELLKDGRAESVCHAIRDLITYQHIRPLNEGDQALLKRLTKILLEEWTYSLAVTPAQAEQEMWHLLTAGFAGD